MTSARSSAPFVQRPLGFPWPTRDPFLFCVHHLDRYPTGTPQLGPTGSLAGRNIGMDFDLKDGFRMYHGEVVPGFPAHPHRGFETVTLARQGYIDHADSLGARARFGHGDVQWMTAGRGIVHSEMFPLVHEDQPNPTELFQIWLNLPARNKMVEPHFSMLWSSTIPELRMLDAKKRATTVTVVSGSFGDTKGPPPPPKSWASEKNADVAIWTLRMEAGAQVELPCAPGTHTSLYFFEGDRVTVAGHAVTEHAALEFGTEPGSIPVVAGEKPAQLLLLGGRPIGEPIAHHGPFVMNSREELVAAYRDYQHTQFGGWPWPSAEPVHGKEQDRFAAHPDGSVEAPAKG